MWWSGERHSLDKRCSLPCLMRFICQFPRLAIPCGLSDRLDAERRSEMKLKVVCQCPPIPTHNYDWVCYDEDTYDMTDYDGETVQFVSSCSIGNGCTEEEAIINFVYT